MAQNFIEKNPGCCRIVSKIERDPEIFGPGVGAAFRPDDTDLKDMFNKAIAEADADGTFKTLASQVLQDRHPRRSKRLTQPAGRRR